MKIKLNSYKLLFQLLDILSNSKWLHKLVVNKKVYLGASIISLSMANSGCTSSKMNVNPKCNTEPNNLNNLISKNKTDSSYCDVPKIQNLDTSVAIIMCYKMPIIFESKETEQDTILNTRPNCETTMVSCYDIASPSYFEENSVQKFRSNYNTLAPDFNDENISRINDLTSNIRRPKGTEKIHGTVFVEFTIMIDGTIRNIRIQKGLHPLLDEEIMKAIRNIHNWVWPINYTPESDIDYVVPIQILSNEN